MQIGLLITTLTSEHPKPILVDLRQLSSWHHALKPYATLNFWSGCLELIIQPYSF